jgi:isopenicillin-N epimerase
MNMHRRTFLRATASVAAGLVPTSAVAAGVDDLPAAPTGGAEQVAADTAYWQRISTEYDVDRSVTNLENAYWGIMSRPVEAAYLERTRFVNRVNVTYVRNASVSQLYTTDMDDVRRRIAEALGCSAGEIAPTRSGAEALQNLFVNYKGLKAGDAVIYADLDYDSTQRTIHWLAERRGVTVVPFNVPEPASRANILEAYDRILRTTPRAKLLLVTHLSNRTGLVMPVADIARMARERRVDVILDAAQTIGHVDFRIGDLGVDFAGFSLHKWIGAPLGTGCLYIKASRLQDISPHLGNEPDNDVLARVFPGTTNFASLLTVPDALTFQARLGGVPRKEARLRYLRNYWVTRVRELENVEILTPDDPALHAAVTSFRLKGTPAAAVQKALLGRYHILTVARTGIAKGDAVRVTPALYNTEPDLDRLVTALRELHGNA